MTVKISGRQIFYNNWPAIKNFTDGHMLVSKMSSNCCVQQEPEILETVDHVDEAVDKAVDEPSVKRRRPRRLSQRMR